MKRFVSRSELHIPILINGYWRTIHFEDTVGGYSYRPKSEEECEALSSHPFCDSGEMWIVEEKEEVPIVRGGMDIPVNQKRYAKADADKKKREIVDGIDSCSDARAYLRERFKDENAVLRSKKEILEYAEARNIFFTGLL